MHIARCRSCELTPTSSRRKGQRKSAAAWPLVAVSFRTRPSAPGKGADLSRLDTGSFSRRRRSPAFLSWSRPPKTWRRSHMPLHLAQTLHAPRMMRVASDEALSSSLSDCKASCRVALHLLRSFFFSIPANTSAETASNAALCATSIETPTYSMWVFQRFPKRMSQQACAVAREILSAVVGSLVQPQREGGGVLGGSRLPQTLHVSDSRARERKLIAKRSAVARLKAPPGRLQRLFPIHQSSSSSGGSV